MEKFPRAQLVKYSSNMWNLSLRANRKFSGGIKFVPAYKDDCRKRYRGCLLGSSVDQ